LYRVWQDPIRKNASGILKLEYEVEDCNDEILAPEMKMEKRRARIMNAKREKMVQ